MDQEREKIRQRSRQGQDERRLLDKGRRGILNVLFGRTMLVALMLAVQVVLLVAVFNSLQSIKYYYALLLLLYGATILHLLN